jgi:hypothetical protein
VIPKFYQGMMISSRYDLREFVSPQAWKQFGESSIWLIDKRIVDFAEWFSDYIDQKAIVNDWHTGREYKQSGYRIPTDQTSKAEFTQHKFGRAEDLKAKGMDYEVLRDVIRDNFKSLNQMFGITTIEKDCPTWLHVDCRWTGLNTLLEVNFK